MQTPLLGLIVRRDTEIEQFKPLPYYVVRAAVRSATGPFTCEWQAPEGLTSVLDQAGRLVSRAHAAQIEAKTAGKPGSVTSASRDKKSEPAPLPYSLAELQVDAGKWLGLGPKETLDVCQALYETHRLVTYPRSDCSYLPEGQHDQAIAVLAAVATNIPALVPAAGKGDRSLRSRAWNDKKITAHHAIIPTTVARPAAELSSAERAVYELVARRYIAQFYPPFEFHETKLEVDIEGERFRASGRQTISEGWRTLIAPLPADETLKNAEDGPVGPLPMLDRRQAITCADVTIADRHTTAPKRFTEATLIQAMTGIARHVQDPKIKQLLRETDGIGTPATQAAIIQTLFDRRFIEKRGRQVVSTEIGRALIQVLPDVTTRPDMTALWEAAMRRIASGNMPLGQFLDGVLEQLRKLIDAGRALGPLTVPQSASATNRPRPDRPARRRGPRRPSTTSSDHGAQSGGRP